MSRSFAVIPAAGQSLRMGRPKLLLPWGASTIVETVLDVWRQGGVGDMVVVVHPDDVELAQLCRSRGARVVVPPTPPEDMRASILRGLEAIAATDRPGTDDVWLMAPADIPELDPAVIVRLLSAAVATPGAILAPSHNGKRGHPVLFPWPFAAVIAQLPAGTGIDQLLAHHDVQSIECGASAAPPDIDTPSEYEERR